MRKRYLPILLLYLFFFTALELEAQVDSLRAVVFDFEVKIDTTKNSVTKNLSTDLRILLEEGLDLDFKILNRSDLAKIMKEKKLSQDLKPFFDQDTAVKDGKFFGARYSIVGQISEILGNTYIIVRLIDNETTVQIGTSEKLSQVQTNDINVAMQQIANNLSYKYQRRYSGEYSTVILSNNTNKSIEIEDDIIAPNTESIKINIKAGQKVMLNPIDDVPNNEGSLYLNKNTNNQIEIYENKGKVKATVKKHKLFISTDAITLLNITEPNNWLAELGYYYHLKNGFYLGLSVNGLSTRYDLTYTTFPNVNLITASEVSTDYFINILLRQDYFIKRVIGKTVYGEINFGASFINVLPKAQIKGGIEFNNWLSFEVGYQIHQYNKKEVTFNPYGYSNNNVIPTWDNRLLVGLKLNYQF